jgi:hypothetical protein
LIFLYFIRSRPNLSIGILYPSNHDSVVHCNSKVLKFH